jgi:dihydrofolate reductase
MSRLIVNMQASLDGFVASSIPGSTWQLWNWGPDWPWSADAKARFNALFDTVHGILLSRPMLAEGYLDHWQRAAEQHPDDPDYRFARRISELPKFVLTQHSISPSWPSTTVINAPLTAGVRQATATAAGDVVCFGGASFVRALLQHHLVDELQLYLNPGIAGQGTGIFDASMATDRYKLIEATPTVCGIVISRWTKPTTPGPDVATTAGRLPTPRKGSA